MRQVRNMLEEQNLRPLMFFLQCLNDDDEIDQLIKREIDCRTRFILCDSENAQSSKWVQKEVEYIKSQDRIYEKIDLNDSIEEIKDQLQQFINHTRLFFSYNREECELAKQVAERLSKYDFSVCMDMLWDFSQKYHQKYDTEILTNLDASAKDGYVIAFVKNRVFDYGSGCRQELLRAIINAKKARRVNPNVILFAISNSVAESLKKDPKLSQISDVVSLESYSETDRCDYAVETILRKLMIPGSILTQANNFKNGINCQKDEEEAEWLYRLCFKVFKEQEISGFPSGCIGVAKCYEFGYGTEINLSLSKEYYRKAMILEYPMATEDFLRVTKKIEDQSLEYSNECGRFICRHSTKTNENILIEFIPNETNLIELDNNRMTVRRLIIPNGIQHFCDDCLRYIEVRDEIILPEGLLSIGSDYAPGVTGCVFANSILPNVKIPDSVHTIGVFAFGKSYIKRLILPKGIESKYGRQFKAAHIETLCVPKEEWEDKLTLNPFSNNRRGYKRRFFAETQIDNIEFY